MPVPSPSGSNRNGLEQGDDGARGDCDCSGFERELRPVSNPALETTSRSHVPWRIGVVSPLRE